MGASLEQLIDSIGSIEKGRREAVYLVSGDLVLAEPGALRVAEALAAVTGCRVEVRRHPGRLGDVLDDLRTYSLFEPGKVILAVDTALLADRRAAADLVDAAAAVLPVEGGGELGGRERDAASRLLQALRLFDLDPDAGEPEAVLERLPDWALQGGLGFRGGRGGRGRGKRQVAELRSGLAALLAAAREAGLAGKGEGDLAALGDLVREGLPEGHALVLAERVVEADHPLVALLAERGTAVALGGVQEERGGGWQGLAGLARELERQTGVAIAPDALEELARRTLRQGRDRRGGVDADSTARLAAEYRKLASLSGQAGQAGQAGARRGIDLAMVEEAVEDRGKEDVWQLLDAVGEGRGDEALERLRRMMATADDELATRLSFFSLLADFCRQLTAVAGMMRAARVPAGERSYPRFKSRWAPTLQGAVPGLADEAPNPLSGLHPYRLHRAYLAASRAPEEALRDLPARVLETELRIKGESGDADVALADLVAYLSSLGRRSRRV